MNIINYFPVGPTVTSAHVIDLKSLIICIVKYISLHGSVYPKIIIFIKFMMYESIINFT